MASGYPGPVSATQVGSFFVGQYYQILRKQPDLAHQFYADSSTMIRIDGDSSEKATGLLQIHTLITSLSFSGIEIKTINSLESWNGGILVVVSGCVKVVDVGGKRKFVETFLLAPQDKGYFVLNDIFHFIEDDVIHHGTVPVLSENRIDSQLPAPTSHREVPGYPTNHYDFEAEASEYVDSVHIEGGNDQIDEYRIEEHEEQLQQQPQVPETHKVLEDIPAEEPSHFRENFAEPVPQPPPRSVEEPVGEPQKLTYASILRAPKGQSAPSVISRPSVTNTTARSSEWQQPQPSLQPPIVAEQPNMDSTEDNPSVEEVEMLKSVYVRNLPSNISAAEIEQEFKNFGRIIPDGVFIRNRKDIGVCYAFVEFEDLQAVQNAIKASPIQLAGRLVYAEERRANSSGAASRGGRAGRGRGRGSYQSDSYRGQYGGRSFGRGFYQDGSDYNRYRGNGFRG